MGKKARTRQLNIYFIFSFYILNKKQKSFVHVTFSIPFCKKKTKKRPGTKFPTAVILVKFAVAFKYFSKKRNKNVHND